MRRGTWILALSGAMALNPGGAFAVDPFEPITVVRDPAKTDKPSVPTRYTRSTGTTATPSAAPAAAPAPAAKRNFYDDLFAEPAAAATPGKTVSTKTFGSTTAGKAAAQRPASAPPAKQIPFEDGNKVFPAAGDKAAVEQAGFEKSGATDKSYIEPVRANSEVPVAKAAPESGSSSVHACSPTVTVTWVKKSDINVGQECHLELQVKNTGTVAAKDLAIDATFPSTVRLTSAEPKPATVADKLTWTMSGLAAGAEQRITLKLIPSRRGDLGTVAEVRFTGHAAATFKVEEPLLKVAIKGPAEAMPGDPVSQIVTITNPGTGVAQDVVLEAQLSEGLEHREGARLKMPVGSISPGESRQVRIGLSAIKGGSQSLQVAAVSSSEASSTATCQISVIAPSLKLVSDGPGLRYKGRHAKYELTVTNDGSVPNNNVRATQSVPDGFAFVAADKGGKFDASQKHVQWFLGRLEPGQSATVTCELTANALGEFPLAASVQSDAGVRAEARTSTRVEGTASLSTSVVDLDDPVEIGSETAWEVRVRNDGSMAASTIAVACELPQGVELLSAKGPTEAAADKRTVLFKSLKQLAPGQQAVYRIHVKGSAEGVHRLRARVTSDSLDEPLLMEEATKFYADGPR